jgi:hypothetical protein
MARIEQAIDELAGESDTAEAAGRLARLWQMVADLDPELSRRIDGYRGADDAPPGPE